MDAPKISNSSTGNSSTNGSGRSRSSRSERERGRARTAVAVPAVAALSATARHAAPCTAARLPRVHTPPPAPHHHVQPAHEHAHCAHSWWWRGWGARRAAAGCEREPGCAEPCAVRVSVLACDRARAVQGCRSHAGGCARNIYTAYRCKDSYQYNCIYIIITSLLITSLLFFVVILYDICINDAVRNVATCW